MLTTSLAVLLHLVPQGPVPDPSSFRKWLEFVQPSEGEQAYRKIGWRNSLWPAVEEARKLGRPILFWTMNGHPLGCT